MSLLLAVQFRLAGATMISVLLYHGVLEPFDSLSTTGGDAPFTACCVDASTVILFGDRRTGAFVRIN